jgi:hypothetical protein
MTCNKDDIPNSDPNQLKTRIIDCIETAHTRLKLLSKESNVETIELILNCYHALIQLSQHYFLLKVILNVYEQFQYNLLFAF